jgi:predicted anti-sigma-YlaC factor YlaD
MIIDIHAHTSNKPMQGLHTPSADLDTLTRYMDAHGVDVTCLMATYFPYKRSGTPNSVLLDRIAKNPRSPRSSFAGTQASARWLTSPTS